MNTDHYKYIITIAETKNISKAAEQLYITQPALTKFINRIESELKIKIFDRSRSPIELTLAGELLVKEGKRILEIEDELLKKLKESYKEKKSVLRIGINNERGSLFLPYVIPEFQKKFPEVEIKVLEEMTNVIEDEMLKGKIDICIETLPIKKSGISYDILGEDPIVLAAPLNNPICKKFDLIENSPTTPYLIEAKELDNQEFIVLVKEQGMGRIAYEMLDKYKINPIIKVILKKNETALRIASTGEGMVFAPVRTFSRIKLINPMAYFTLENPIFSRKLIVSYQETTGISDDGKNFSEILKKVIENTESLKTPVCNVIINKKKY